MFQFPGLSPSGLYIQPEGIQTPLDGFAHSGTPGSKDVCSSPGTIAACRALRRLPVPRHPPCARGILAPLQAGPHVLSTLADIQSSLEHVSCMLMNSALIRFNGFRIPRHALWHARDQMLLLRIRSCFFLLDRIIAMQYLSQKENLDTVTILGDPLFAMRLSRYAGRTPRTGCCGGWGRNG